MELLTHRYRNLGVLAVVILTQLVLLGYQVRTRGEIRLVRVWAVTAVTPVARVAEAVRSGVGRVLDRYLLLVGVEEENRRLRKELDDMKLETWRLESALGTARRAESVELYRAQSPSKTVAARVIGAGTGSRSDVVFIDRGSASGVTRGMAVITPEGIVGRVSAAYPTASQVVLLTDPTFAAGVVSQRTHVYGTLKGQGTKLCLVDYVQNNEVVEEGEWFYTTGDDRVFPKGLPVGVVRGTRESKMMKQILVEPAGLKNGLEEVLVVIEGVHVPIPEAEDTAPDKLLPPPPPEISENSASSPEPPAVQRGTDADRLLDHYRRVGEAQGHVFGEGLPGSAPPDFNHRENATEPVSGATPVPGSLDRDPSDGDSSGTGLSAP